MAGNDDKIKALSEEQSEKLLGKEVFRSRTNEIIAEYIGTVAFMAKVREYSGMEIDSRMFRSVKYWATLVISSIITSAIGVAITIRFASKS